MEMPDIERILREANIQARTIFYGVEDIATRSPAWKIFAIIKRLTPYLCNFTACRRTSCTSGCSGRNVGRNTESIR